MLHLDSPNDQEKCPDGIVFGWKVSGSGRYPEFEKFRNSFSDITSKPMAQNKLRL
jgi:hypothetical protein